jgi:hypothetical protein
MLLTTRSLGTLWVALFALSLLVTTAAQAETRASAPRRSSKPLGRQGATGTERIFTRGYVPAHERGLEADFRVLEEEGPAETDEHAEAAPEVIFEDEGMEHMVGEPMMDDGCGGCSHRGCLIPCPSLCCDSLEFFAGAHGFTGPINRGETGSFGFNEGVNWGAPLPCLFCGELGMQLGIRATHSNFSGASFTESERNQVFVTGGIFRRVDYGFQGGVVVDYLSEDWYLDSELVQLRGELSWVYPCRHEIGFWFTAHLEDEETVSSPIGTSVLTEELAVTDLYAFFYRYRVDNVPNASGRLFAGFTGESDGLVGADILVPVNDCWSVQSGFAYLVPEEGSDADGHVEESWNFGLSLVWRPGGNAGANAGYYRPLFDVAHNGNFMVDRR